MSETNELVRASFGNPLDLLSATLPASSSWTLTLSDGTIWCGGSVDASSNLIPHPFSTTRAGAFFPLSELQMAITDLTLATGGTGYVAGDIGKTVTLVGGTSTTAATALIADVAAGAVTELTFVSGGVGYTAGVANGATMSGAGNDDLTVNPTWGASTAGYLEPVFDASGVSISTAGIVLTASAGAKPRVRLPILVNRPGRMEMHCDVPLSPTTGRAAILATRTAAAAHASDDSFGSNILYIASWQIANYSRNNGTGSLGAQADAPAAAARKLKTALYQSDGQANFFTLSHQWGSPAVGTAITAVTGATLGQDNTSTDETYYIDLWNGGTSVSTVIGVRIYDEGVGEGFS